MYFFFASKDHASVFSICINKYWKLEVKKNRKKFCTGPNKTKCIYRKALNVSRLKNIKYWQAVMCVYVYSKYTIVLGKISIVKLPPKMHEIYSKNKCYYIWCARVLSSELRITSTCGVAAHGVRLFVINMVNLYLFLLLLKVADIFRIFKKNLYNITEKIWKI